MTALGRVNLSTRVIALCVFTSGAVGGFGCSDADEPQRPPGVPASAIWVGGADGGVFLRLEKRSEDPPSTYRASVYSDSSGDLIFEGPLGMIPEDHVPIPLADPKTFSAWDGESLHLADGGRLTSAE